MIIDLSTASDLFIFMWLAVWAIKAGRSILAGHKYSVNFLILTHFIFSGVPSILNVLIGHPLYFLYPKFQLLQDANVDVLYAIYVSVCPLIWWYFGRPKTTYVQLTSSKTSFAYGMKFARRFRYLLYALACSPALVVCGSPDPSFYTSYAAVIRSTMSEAMVRYQGWVTISTLLCVFSVAAIWVSCKHFFLAFLTWLPMLGIAIWINGKRNIVLMVVAITVMVLWERRAITGWKLALVAALVTIGFAEYSYSYQSGVRSIDGLTALAQYEGFRIDYGRDHVIKYALYCELHPEQNPILEYRGQSILFDLSIYVPREIWPDKPWPYAVYSTAAALGRQVENLGWGITTSWLEESIANFSFWGLIIAPLSLAAFCRVGDSSQKSLCRFLTIINACLALTVQTSAFAVIAIAWLLAIATEWQKQKVKLKMHLAAA